MVFYNSALSYSFDGGDVFGVCGVGVVGVVPTFLTEKIKQLAADGLIADPDNPKIVNAH